ncbi:alcohol dehydrogenase catalytic domain-containing protein, partial [Enterococcus faecium]|uniref:alcohol dehydrogenase catalytic domain-containing protein n=1 Tax=Enterococcus faecium TaxID=1352 RepID=UPI00292DA5AB
QGELLIKVHTAAVNRTDIMKRESVSLKPPYPILGVEVAGEVVAKNLASAGKSGLSHLNDIRKNGFGHRKDVTPDNGVEQSDDKA